MASTTPITFFRSTWCRSRAIKGVAQARSFTNTIKRRKHGALPAFSETSSTELNTLLSAMRNRVFLPSHLLKKQKAMVHGQKYKKLLDSDPIYAEIGDEKIRLQHINPLTDKPNTKKTFARMLELMTESNDWSNFRGVLEGLVTAGRPLSNAQLEKVARRASQAGQQDVVMDCIRGVRKTSFFLRDKNVVTEIMLGIHLKAIRAEWEELPTRKALANAEQLVDLLEDPVHNKGLIVPEMNPQRQPNIIGIVLELAAVRASRHMNGNDEDGKVLLYAERLMATWENADLTVNSWLEANHKLAMWAPVRNGLILAAEVLESNPLVSKQIKSSLHDVDKLVAKAKDTLSSTTPKLQIPRGLALYDALFGT